MRIVRGGAALAVGSMVAGLLLVGAQPAAAAPLPAPGSLVVVGSPPKATWGPVDGATRYRVTFFAPGGATVEEFDTRGRVATPTKDVPPGTGAVSVAAFDTDGVLGAAATTSLPVPGHDAPVITAPVGNVTGPPGNAGGEPQLPTISYPTVPVLSWQPVQGAKDYQVTLSSTNASYDFTTRTTSVVPTEALALAVQGVDKVWSWTVRWRSADDVVSDAAASAFRIIWPVAPTLDGALTPNDTDSPIDLPTTPAVTDTTLKWSPVPGAVKYQLQVYISNDFADASKRVVDETVRTTRYSPLGNELNNASYWWRVRPVYPGESQFGEWSEVWRFQRKWGAQDGPALSPTGGPEIGQLARPAIVSPADGASVAEGALVLSWTPVPRATKYEVQWRTLGVLSWDNAPGCTTWHTSLTQGSTCDALPGAGTTFEWRVRAVGVDGRVPSAQQAIRSNWSSEDYVGDPVTVPSATVTARAGSIKTLAQFIGVGVLTPSSPQVTDAPVLSWSRVSTPGGPEYGGYRVQLALDEAFTNVSYTYATRGTSFVPPDDLLDNTVGEAYYYRVIPCSSPGQGCLSNSSAATGVFAKRGTPAEPVVVSDADSGATGAAPFLTSDQVRLSWTPRSVYALDDGAISGYRVQVSTQPDFANGSIVDEATVAQPWHVSTAKLYPNTVNASDRLYTRVQAISGAGQGLPWSTTTSFRKASATLSQLKATDGATCAASGTNTFLRAPLLCWAPAALTETYQVEVYRSGVQVAQSSSKHAAYAPTGLLEPGSYTWRVRRIDISGNASAWTSGADFTVGFDAPTGLAPAESTVTSRGSLLLTWSSVPGALRYRVVIDQAGDSFSSPVESWDTPWPQFAPRNELGQGAYEWRVTAIDGNGNASAAPSSRSGTATFTVVTAPGAPPNVTLQRSGAKSVNVTWSAPPTGGSPITEYRMRYRVTGASTWTVIELIGPAQGAYNLGGLADQTEYQVQVGARNAVDWSQWSSTVAIQTAQVPGTVGAPTVSGQGSGKLRVQWAAPSDGGSAITRYEVQALRTGVGVVKTVLVPSPGAGQTPPTQALITGLTAGRYDVRVRAVNAVGAGLFGTTAGVAAITVPGAPAWGTTSSAAGKVLLRWRAPSANGSRITRYVVQVKRSKTFATIAVTWNKAAKAWVWSGGRRGTIATFRVAAVNGVGQGSWSALRAVRVR